MNGIITSRCPAIDSFSLDRPVSLPAFEFPAKNEHTSLMIGTRSVLIKYSVYRVKHEACATSNINPLTLQTAVSLDASN